MAWSRTNPATNTLPDIPKEAKGKETKLFGTGFLERAAKRLEDEKALAKVTRTRQGPPPAKCRKPDQDPNESLPFFKVVPLQNTAAGTQGVNSCTPRKDQSSSGKGTTEAHTSKERGTVRLQCTHQQLTIYQQHLIPYP